MPDLSLFVQTEEHPQFLHKWVKFPACKNYVDRSHTLIGYGALTLNLPRAKTLWSSLKNFMELAERADSYLQ